IPGTVVGINVDETEQVNKGDDLVTLDAGDTDVAVRKAEAGLAQAVRQTQGLFARNDALRADIAARKADVERAQSDLSRAQSDLKRRQALARSGGVSGEEILHAQNALKAAQSGLSQARAAQALSQAQLETNLAL